MKQTSFQRQLRFCIFLTLLAVLNLNGCKAKKEVILPNQLKSVNISTVAQTNVSFFLTGFGTVEPQRTVDLLPQVSGNIKAVHFQEGSVVTSGQLMFEIDDRDYRENLIKAKSAVDTANASFRLAEDRLKRNEQLADKKMISADTLESLRNAVQQARDNVASFQAAVRQAELQIEYCAIRSPMAGIVGKSQIDPGNLALQGQTKLTTVRQIDPIRVQFSIAGRDLFRLQSAMTNGLVPIIVKSSNTASESHEGKVEFIDSSIDSTTGTIKVIGTLTNSDRLLWPGQFVSVKVKVGEQLNAPVISQGAVGIGADGPFVFVIEKEKIARLRKVVLGELSGDWVLVKEGLKTDDLVVTEGQINLIEGSRVKIVNRATSL